MTLNSKLLADVCAIGMVCGIYLQYKGFKTMKAVSAIKERGNRALTHHEAWALAGSVAYALIGAFVEIVIITFVAFG